jgi:hypothetical protein
MAAFGSYGTPSEEQTDLMKSVGEWAMFHQNDVLFDACCEYFELHGVEIAYDSRFSVRSMFYGCRKALRKLEVEDINELYLSEVSAHVAHIVSETGQVCSVKQECNILLVMQISVFESSTLYSFSVPRLTQLKHDTVIQVSGEEFTCLHSYAFACAADLMQSIKHLPDE